jgi:choline dehydrogenase
VLEIYRRIEDWRGIHDTVHPGVGEPVYLRPAADPNPIAAAILEDARQPASPLTRVITVCWRNRRAAAR